ncbi:MAG: hypothetical protein JW818_15755 [Pirellulales bacterium]|nr:hypothetical protein [Pirellulales bacterium]
MRRPSWCCLMGCVVVLTAGMAMAGPPEAPKVSTFAPAKDLAGQVDYFLGRLEGSVENAEEYADSKENIVKDANTLIVIALALGLHDEDNAYKSSAPAMIKACQTLAATRDFDSAKAAVEAVKKASTSKAGGAEALQWDKKEASLKALMEAVPTINTKLKRYTKGSRLKKKAKDTAGYTAVLAAIAQASFAHPGDTKYPERTDDWYKECQIMRDAAAEVNAGIRAADAKATKKAMKKLAESCETCHAIFKPEQVGKQTTEED